MIVITDLLRGAIYHDFDLSNAVVLKSNHRDYGCIYEERCTPHASQRRTHARSHVGQWRVDMIEELDLPDSNRRVIPRPRNATARRCRGPAQSPGGDNGQR